MESSTEELKKIFQNRSNSNLAPKPYGASNKFNSIKPPTQAGDENLPKQGFGISSNQLQNLKLRPTVPDTKANGTTKDSENKIPEFQRTKLKTPAEKKAEISQKISAQKVIANAISKEPSFMKCPPPVAPQKPLISPKQNCAATHVVHENENDRKRSLSIQERSSIFEKSTSLPLQKPSTLPKTWSMKGSSPKVTEKPAIPSAKPNRLLADTIKVTEDELYDDVAQVTEEINIKGDSNFDLYDGAEDDFPEPPTDTSQNNLIEEELYDDVIEHIADKSQQPKQLFSNQTDDFYDDVDSHALQEQQQTQVQDDDIYDDVDSHALQEQQQTQVQDDDFYNDITLPSPLMSQQQQQEITISDQDAPMKLPKSFHEIPQEKLIIPFGLERWLQTALLTHKLRLKSFAKSPFNPPMIQRDIKPLEKIPTEDEVQSDQDVYDDLSIHSENDPASKSEKSEKERKKEEKERMEREKKEKKDKEKREKEEKRKEKKEKDRREKEYRQFGFNPDQPLLIVGSVSCCTDFIPKNKQDIQYSIGDEINIIEYKKAPSGKMLVQNVTTGRLGFVSRKDFGVEEEIDPEPRNRSVSLIPTEDDDQDLYEDIPGQQAMFQAPPVPETPRPNLHTGALEEELYNDVDDPGEVAIEDQIYETL